jgi:hypothetical protein
MMGHMDHDFDTLLWWKNDLVDELWLTAKKFD